MEYGSKLGPASEPYEIITVDTVRGCSGNRLPKRYMHILVNHFSRADKIAVGNYPSFSSSEMKNDFKKCQNYIHFC